VSSLQQNQLLVNEIHVEKPAVNLACKSILGRNGQSDIGRRWPELYQGGLKLTQFSPRGPLQLPCQGPDGVSGRGGKGELTATLELPFQPPTPPLRRPSQGMAPLQHLVVAEGLKTHVRQLDDAQHSASQAAAVCAVEALSPWHAVFEIGKLSGPLPLQRGAEGLTPAELRRRRRPQSMRGIGFFAQVDPIGFVPLSTHVPGMDRRVPLFQRSCCLDRLK
jgi:hypothetical protein